MKHSIMRTLFVGLVFISLLAGCGSDNSSSSQQSAAKIPATPTNITATSQVNKITLSWNPVASADSYNIYWSTHPGVSRETGTRVSVATNNFQHIGLFISQTYFYVVAAVSSAGESVPSEQAATVVATDGANLYAIYCQGCHGPVTATSITEGTDVNIRQAIAANKGGMGSLSTLTDSQLFVISQQLPCH